MDRREIIGAVLSILLGIAAMFAFVMCGFIVGRNFARDEAIDHGVAEWRCDPTTGEREFVWLGQTEERSKEEVFEE